MQTKWKVITGPPSSGKTTMILRLAASGLMIRPEAATLHLESRLRDTRQPLSVICAPDQQPVLQREIALLNAALEAEIAHEPHVGYVLDRSVIDGLAYCKFYGHDDSEVRRHIVRRYHPIVILLDRLPTFEANHVRCENDEMAARLDVLYEEVYRELDYEVVRIPVPAYEGPEAPREVQIEWSVQRRVELILRHWNE